MPLTRRQRTDMNSRYNRWRPEEEAYFISKLDSAARRDHVQDLENLRLTLERIVEKMNERFHRRFHLTLLKLKLERIRREYIDFKEFLDQPGIHYDPYSSHTSVSNKYWIVISPHREPGSYRRYRTEGHPHYRKLRYLFDHKQCAIFPRPLLGSPLYPIDLSANDEDALLDSPIRIIDGNHESKAAAPPSEEVNPVATIVYDGGNAGAAGDVNDDMGGHISDVD